MSTYEFPSMPNPTPNAVAGLALPAPSLLVVLAADPGAVGLDADSTISGISFIRKSAKYVSVKAF